MITKYYPIDMNVHRNSNILSSSSMCQSIKSEREPELPSSMLSIRKSVREKKKPSFISDYQKTFELIKSEILNDVESIIDFKEEHHKMYVRTNKI